MTSQDERFARVTEFVRFDHRKLVGVAGFEPATSCSQGTRANQAALHPANNSYSSE